MRTFAFGVLFVAAALSVSGQSFIGAGTHGTFYNGWDLFDSDSFATPAAQEAAVLGSNAQSSHDSFSAAVGGVGVFTYEDFEAGFPLGSIGTDPFSTTVNGVTYGLANHDTAGGVGGQSGFFNGTTDLDPGPGGTDSTRGYNMAPIASGFDGRNYFQIKPLSGASGEMNVAFGANVVRSFGFWLTGIEDTKNAVAFQVDYGGGKVDTRAVPQAAGSFGIGTLQFLGYIGDGDAIQGFSLVEATGVNVDIMAIDSLGYTSAVPEPEEWTAITMAFLGGLVLWRRRERALAPANIPPSR